MRSTRRHLLSSFLGIASVVGTALFSVGGAPPASAQSPSLQSTEENAPSANRYRASWHRRRHAISPNQGPPALVPLNVAAEFGVNFSEGAWQLSVNDITTESEYAPWQAVLTVAQQARTTRPSGQEWAFLGAPAGATISVLPQFQTAGLLYLAVSAEDTAAGTLKPYDVSTASGGRTGGVAPWVRLQLVKVFGPGAFSVWSAGEFGDTTVWMTSANGVGASDAVWVPEGEDIHLNWGFSKSGFYRVVCLASAYLPGQTQPLWSRPVVYRFQVE